MKRAGFHARQLMRLSLTSALLFLAVDPCAPVSAASSSNHLPIVDEILTRCQAVSTRGPLIAVRPAVEQPARFKSQPASEAVPPIATEWWQLYRDPI